MTIAVDEADSLPAGAAPRHRAQAIDALSIELGRVLQASHLIVTTAESCTGGLIAGAITDVAGSSAWFLQGAVTYSNEAKQRMLGVDAVIFDTAGAVSEACVLAMARGACERAGANLAVSVSGIAGPGGATAGKPVGTVWIGWALPAANILKAQAFVFAGDRRAVRQQAVCEALRGTIALIDNAGSFKQ